MDMLDVFFLFMVDHTQKQGPIMMGLRVDLGWGRGCCNLHMFAGLVGCGLVSILGICTDCRATTTPVLLLLPP